ncbi:MAG: DNA repair protein RecO C-terminal domain-containing protein [Synergistaceae bacterium]|jgi:DNA repair protein RecO (recombination protein O)|nr:DNA repair protein RecO C-terminal domain-containing protein [Synergistaceae bacterium]
MEKVSPGDGAGRIPAEITKIIPLGEERLPQGDHRANGVVLRRRDVSGRSQELLLFLHGFGATWVSAPGSGTSNRFGGGTEPMTWGVFRLYQSPRRLYLKGVDIRESFLGVRRSKSSLCAAVKWCLELSSRLPTGHESDPLLSLLWGSMKNLSCGVSHLLIDARFAWRWANLWGLAPSLDRCTRCGREIRIGGARLAARSSDGFICGECLRGARDGSEGRALLSPISSEAVLLLRTAATLPRDGFAAWAKAGGAESIRDAGIRAELEDCSLWLYSFL